ncbi:hypothetical protein OS493_024977 [Desmophyllum pertusum]|uniref:Uncharacterized protein n=1 Tax=Desmophyllum pertusum TaxID=174260 RepID=A0A9W9YLJ8_9CNID|nr:hypothetical protein OS493_024977 [Desmophyllum pertusum]
MQVGIITSTTVLLNPTDAQNSSEMDPQGQGQKIKERVERIMELVRSTTQNAESVPIVQPETPEEPSNQV